MENNKPFLDTWANSVRMPSTADKECIRTLCRFRPLNARELGLQSTNGADGQPAHVMTFSPDGRAVSLGEDKTGGQYTLDAMLSPDASQQDVYDQIAGIVDSVLQGYNGTLLAYGQAPGALCIGRTCYRAVSRRLSRARRPARARRTL